MNIIYKLFRQDPDSRDDIIATTSALGAALNLLIAGIKIFVGLAVSSIAIVSEGANNATDALSSCLTLVGSKLAGKHPDKTHPFGYRRIEYLTGLVVGVLIFVTGAEAAIASAKLIFAPEELAVSYVTIAIVAVSAVVKFFFGTYTIKMGRKTGSAALEGVGIEGRNDSFASALSIGSILIFLLTDISVDAYAGVVISLLIVKAGFDVLKETFSELIGRSGKKELADALYQEIRSTEGVVAAADMMLHNYGPGAWSGSANIEIDHKKSVGETYQFLHALQLRILREYKVTMVFGIYAVNNDDPELKELRRTIKEFIAQNPNAVSFHALYLDRKAQKIYCDLVVDYELRDWNEIRTKFDDYIGKFYPQYQVELTVETEYV